MTTTPTPVERGGHALIPYTSGLLSRQGREDRARAVLEAACVILAIPTYQLWGTPGRWSTTTRHQPGLARIGRVPPAGDVVVLAAHACTRPPLASEQLRMTTTTRPALTDPPY